MSANFGLLSAEDKERISSGGGGFNSVSIDGATAHFYADETPVGDPVCSIKLPMTSLSAIKMFNKTSKSGYVSLSSSQDTDTIIMYSFNAGSNYFLDGVDCGTWTLITPSSFNDLSKEFTLSESKNYTELYINTDSIDEV